ncbi:MAG TPA: hypothetical protein VEV21_02010 [Burkholderiales bacterium]|nr:hypothetical protein [Burkholderiales bacterium]
MKRVVPGLLAVALAGCVSTPTGPSVMVLAGSGKSYEQFRFDDYECRQYAQSSVGMSADQAAAQAGAKSAALGAAIGGLAGAAIGGRAESAVAGAGIGAAGGAIAGAGAGAESAHNVQQRYDNAYMQCMYARGNQVPMSGRYAAPPARQLTPPVPPPPDLAPPRG